MSTNLIAGLQSLLDRMKNDERTAVMFEADGDTLRDAIRALRTQPAASEAGAVPVAWQFYSDGKWWNGDDRIPSHRANTEEAGYPVRDLIVAPPSAPAAEPVPQTVLDALKAWTGAEPSQSMLARALDAWRDPGVVSEHEHAAPAAESAEPEAKQFRHSDRELLRRALDWMTTSKDRPNMLASLIHEALHGEPAYFAAATADAQGDEPSLAKIIETLDEAHAQAANVSGSALLSGDVPAKQRAAQEAAVYECARNALVGIGAALHYAKQLQALSRQPSAPASAAEGTIKKIQVCIDELAYLKPRDEDGNITISRVRATLVSVRAALAAAKPEGGE